MSSSTAVGGLSAVPDGWLVRDAATSRGGAGRSVWDLVGSADCVCGVADGVAAVGEWVGRCRFRSVEPAQGDMSAIDVLDQVIEVEARGAKQGAAHALLRSWSLTGRWQWFQHVRGFKFVDVLGDAAWGMASANEEPSFDVLGHAGLGEVGAGDQ